MNTLQGVEDLRKETPSDWQRERRTEYLKHQITALIVKVWELMDLHEDYVKRNRLIEMVLTQEGIEEALREVLKAQGEIISLRLPMRERKDRITPEMIERAKAHSFTDLIDFKNKSAMCPFHEGKTPALRYYSQDNLVWCFTCSKRWDPIQWVKDKEGLTFTQAVRQLQ
jgi:hypothetical protein